MTFKKYFFLILMLHTSIIASLYAQQNQNGTITGDIAEKELVIADQEENELIPDENRPGQLGTFTFWDFLRMVLILVFVILCIYGLFYVLKKAGTQKYDDNDLINIISSKALSPGKSLHIIEIGNQVICIGASDNSISLITEITDKETADRIRLYKGEIKKPSENSFYRYLLGTLMKGKDAGSAGKGSSGERASDFTSEFLKRQKDRIEKM